MSESVYVTAAVAVARSRLRAYLNAPVAPAAGWTPERWAGLPGADPDELPAAIAEADRWLAGDAATVLRDLARDDELTLRYDEATGSLAADVAARADFRLPALVWAVTVFRGLAAFMAGDDHGLVTVNADWSDDDILLRLAPGHARLLDRGRDARAVAEARGRAIDVEAAARDAGDDPADDVIDRLLDG
ncbi:hypothetical protein Daura_12820 [Dactylosporangium aurantiacum]|uniref:Uncharacterized protein n=1 Tax=Dactylosporangium aurantiacum TaxID=35754 RepID=A0A9Q9MPV4_9ACTN|nr:hypothetical protein [Dactylosporangium aurantiacum]MDG6105709.1 hypothetical protein [Dactylosporangium aurantiacum]UWZ56967.1 hypothetical protein Daura_12820 [Dactylosporangium aurantiacum]